MKYNRVLILMYKDFEVLSFGVNFEKQEVEFIKKLEHIDKGPNGMSESSTDEEINKALRRFVLRSHIPGNRTNYQQIIKGVGVESGFELAFRGHGLSLSNHYWYKKEGESLLYKDINFFENKWDDSFARAVINEDYEALKHCDLNVPDIVTAGWGVKGWIYEEDGPKLYKLGINEGHSEEALAEVLASSIASQMFDEGEVLKYELRKVGDRYASASPVMINIDEDLIPLDEYLSYDIYLLYRNKTTDKSKGKKFFDYIKNSEIPGLYKFFVKLGCFRDLCFVNDLHFENISLIKNSKTGKVRIAPLYDLGSAFGSSRTGQSIISKIDKSTFLLVYYLFNDLDPEWDYSWYNPDKLIGYEEEIRRVLSLSNFYTPEIVGCIIQVYQHQKEMLEETAKNSLKNK